MPRIQSKDKSIRLRYGPWRRARICAIETGETLSLWVAKAIAMRADLQERDGHLSKLGQRVAASAVVLKKQESQHESGHGVQSGAGTGDGGGAAGERDSVG
jgi:hypothetical protein